MTNFRATANRGGDPETYIGAMKWERVDIAEDFLTIHTFLTCPLCGAVVLRKYQPVHIRYHDNVVIERGREL